VDCYQSGVELIKMDSAIRKRGQLGEEDNMEDSQCTKRFCKSKPNFKRWLCPIDKYKGIYQAGWKFKRPRRNIWASGTEKTSVGR